MIRLVVIEVLFCNEYNHAVFLTKSSAILPIDNGDTSPLEKIDASLSDAKQELLKTAYNLSALELRSSGGLELAIASRMAIKDYM